MSAVPSVVDDNPPSINSARPVIHDKLRSLLYEEVKATSDSTSDSYLKLIMVETRRYGSFLFWNITYAVFFTLFGGLDLLSLSSIWFYAVGSSTLLAFALPFCLIVRFPPLVGIYFAWSSKHGGGLGVVNAWNPNIFKVMTLEQAAAAKGALSASYKDSPNTKDHRVFDLDVARLLLQMAAVIYEHRRGAIYDAVASREHGKLSKPAASRDNSTSSTGGLQGHQTPTSAAKAVDSEADRHIREFVKAFGLDYEPISELHNTSSAFAGLFWDPKSNWIVVSFKGTSPLDFTEWASDLDVRMVECKDQIKGFSKCHLGFRERIFPYDSTSHTFDFKPYDTIVRGVKTLAEWLRNENELPEETKVNVWFTGHSLGCAIASLVYSRMLMEDDQLGQTAVLRDAYLFAAPVTTDRASVEAFNKKMKEVPDQVKTMWRVTSNGDFVATLLPELGDHYSTSVGPDNAFALAHLGAELVMKDHPTKSRVSGSHLLHGCPVRVHSLFTPAEIAAQRTAELSTWKAKLRERAGVWLQMIPGFGRIAAHATVFYWDQLSRIGVGECQWEVD
ncbi:alpha/beta-hydrolase [Clavulina sp. PMI_390]|nr:alpha/beta-hydrolase [Clavulina sp. PMI_390]